jgi:hydroxyacylglutathione hydrolase
MLTLLPIKAFSDNYIWLLYDASTRQAFVVDPGDAQPVIDTLTKLSLNLVGILVTHHHFDHVGGLEVLIEQYSPHIYGPHNPSISGISERLGEGDIAAVLGHEFRVMEVPGHTMDHIAYFYAGEQPLLFCGDTLFAGGCGRLFEGTPAMMHGSLNSLAALPANTLVYCAHEYTLANLAFALAVEPDNEALQQRVSAAQKTRHRGEPTIPSPMSLELATNPFLRCCEDVLQQSLSRQGKESSTDSERVFTVVRAWKDEFII